MQYKGNILKMRTSHGEVIDYHLPIGDNEIPMNELIGNEISFRYLGQINCIYCGAKTKTSFSQGYCFKCHNTLPQTDVSIVNPELDKSHLGISRDMEWARKNSLVPHCLYLALSSGLKVGVTRESQIPTRWIDQGAVQAVRVARTPNRHIAGVMEVALKAHFADKTNWRQMLGKKSVDGVNLMDEKQRAINLLHPELKQYVTSQDEVVSLNYPVLEYPNKVSSITFNKVNQYRGILKGIKGQYLIFEDRKVLNIRRHAGYLMEIAY